MASRINPPYGTIQHTPTEEYVRRGWTPYSCGHVGPLLTYTGGEMSVTYLWFAEDVLFRFRHPGGGIPPSWAYRIYYDDGTYEVFVGDTIYERGTWTV